MRSASPRSPRLSRASLTPPQAAISKRRAVNGSKDNLGSPDEETALRVAGQPDEPGRRQGDVFFDQRRSEICRFTFQVGAVSGKDLPGFRQDKKTIPTSPRTSRDLWWISSTSVAVRTSYTGIWSVIGFCWRLFSLTVCLLFLFCRRSWFFRVAFITIIPVIINNWTVPFISCGRAHQVGQRLEDIRGCYIFTLDYPEIFAGYH